MSFLPITMVWSALHFFLAAKALPKDVALAAEQPA